MPRQTTLSTIYSAQALTAQTASSSVDVRRFKSVDLFIRITAKSGTNPSVSFVVEASDDNTNFHTLFELPTVLDPTITFLFPVVSVREGLGRYVRLNNPDGIGGSSTPSLTVTAVAIARD